MIIDAADYGDLTNKFQGSYMRVSEKLPNAKKHVIRIGEMGVYDGGLYINGINRRGGSNSTYKESEWDFDFSFPKMGKPY